MKKFKVIKDTKSHKYKRNGMAATAPVFYIAKRFWRWYFTTKIWTIYEVRANEYCDALNAGTVTLPKLKQMLFKHNQPSHIAV